jgi:CRISPR-associated protein Cmr6
MTNTPRQPNRPNLPQNLAFNSPQPRRNNTQGGGNRNGGNNNQGGGNNNNHNNNNNNMPNPWLFEKTPPTIDDSASFVEYLRWMRSPDYQYKDGTKIEILHKAQEKARNYSSRLNTLNQRTKLMAEVFFEAKSSWRLRVGGHRGPENILLPAFDALGMPYLPSSSLRGVARNYAIRELMNNESIKWEEAEKKIAPYFGSIDTNNKADQAGKVVFFDAYPTAGCLEMDMANNIWTWENNILKYSPNPNPFLSLKDAIFVIGLRLANNCKNKAILDTVKNWLIKGLQEGIGSQINSGYGQLKELESQIKFKNKFLTMKFTLKGQLIHGSQKLQNLNQPLRKNRDGTFRLNQGKYQYDTYANEEVRSTAFKSMLRYWFRAFALGVLSVDKVQEWESKLFGLIQPKNTAWVKFNILNGKTVELDDECDKQKGTLILSYSPFILEDKKTIISDLFNNLIWLTFRLGGIGQGARRSYYERNNNPYYRGSKIYPENPDDDKFWTLSRNSEQLAIKFKIKIKGFYQALEKLTNQNQLINNSRNQFSQTTNHKWSEVIDSNCKIILVSGDNQGNKPFALNLLHQHFHQLENNRNYTDAKSLCGGTKKERNFYGENQDRDVMPSPIWTNDLKLFEVVTVFGATQNPRKKYLEELKNKAKTGSYHQIFPF